MLLANKLTEKIPDPCNAKEHYQSFIRKKSRKAVKQSEIIIDQIKIFENPNIALENQLSKTIGQAEKVGSSSPLYGDTKKLKIFQTKKIQKYQNEHMLLKAMQFDIMLKF